MQSDLSQAAAALGKKGGAVKSPAKAEAAKANGAKGGRPGKLVAPDGTEYRVVPRVVGQPIDMTMLRDMSPERWATIAACIKDPRMGCFAIANNLILPKS